MPAELEYIGVPLVNRTTPYTGPGVEELPNLITEQKNTILALLRSSRIINVFIVEVDAFAPSLIPACPIYNNDHRKGRPVK